MNAYKHDRGPQDADELLQAAERALFDATSRLQEALVLMDRQGLETSPGMPQRPQTGQMPQLMERMRQWSALIQRGVDRLEARKPRPVLTHPVALEA